MGNDNGKMTYSFEIDKFSQRTTVFSTPIFSTGSCNWYVNLYPKGDMNTSKNMSLWLRVPDPLLRPLSWSRRTSFRFVIVNPSNVNSSRTLISANYIFNKVMHSGGFRTDLSLSKLQEKKIEQLIEDGLRKVVLVPLRTQLFVAPPLSSYLQKR
ncbi:MATH domain and coiled-coil domain-containing protein At2g42480-like [Raphanus sativus]|uniref:MATH domain and coiled-coil domain-containing protein At2g42480-like n=1 Tax=Raphanus sativus TaxID=3726 RepID=A0A9W3BYE5_RAPSA|nr:MATH domain and coiled-coil domain-containing protein At2g42480-like [Raphanus sativus]